MAKSQKAKVVQYYNSKLDKSLLLSDKYTYSVEIYKYNKGSFNLEDSKFITSTSVMETTVEKVFYKDEVRFKSVQEMIAAPESWLIKHNYVKK